MKTDTYFGKLMKIIDGEGYSCLMKTLFSIDFYSDLPLDQNLVDRVKDFRWEIGYVGTDLPSVFEVLVILSMDIERNIMHKTEAGNRVGEWYWAMMRNLGFEYFDDEDFDDRCCDVVYQGIDILLNREYRKDGSDGGLFPLHTCDEDLRNVPLWTQACWWLRENYSPEFRINVI